MSRSKGAGGPAAQLRRIFRLALCAIVVLIPVCAGGADVFRPQELADQTRVVLETFASDSDMTESLHGLASETKALFVLPDFLRWGFVVGGAGGEGLLIVRDEKTGQWSQPVFYHVGSMNLGAQVGMDVSEIVIVVRTQKGLEEFYGTGFKLGAGASMAAGRKGSSVLGIGTDMVAYARRKGVFAGITMGGALVTVAGDLNRSYYGKPVEPREIVRGEVTNRRSVDLRDAAGKLIK